MFAKIYSMDTIKDFFANILNHSKERSKNPFIGSLTLSFIIYNWEIFAILFSSEWPIHCQIEWIREKYYQEHNFLIPLGIAFFYVLFLPYLNIIFDLFLSRAVRIEAKKAELIRDNKLLIEEREAHQRRKIADAQAGTSQINDLKERNEALQSEMSELSTQNQEDLKRHNKSMEKYKQRVHTLLNENKALLIYSKQMPVDLDIIDPDLSFSEIRDVVNIVDNFSDTDQSNYINFVKELSEQKDIKNIYDLPEYKRLGLIAVSDANTKNEKTLLTKKGLFLANYLQRGLDLL